jgi:trehalose/maltose hydrolase-like predicted phosphorylase
MSDPTWCIEFDHYDEEDERRRTSLLALSNGMLSCRPSAPEASAGAATGGDGVHYAGFYRAGWYDDAPRLVNGRITDVAALVNLPHPFGLSIRLDGGSWMSADNIQRLSYRQTLRLDEAVVEREMTFALDDKQVQLFEVWLVDMAQGNQAALSWTLRLPESVQRIQIRAGVDAGVANTALTGAAAYEGQRLQGMTVQTKRPGEVTASAHLHDRRWRMAMASRIRVYPPAEHAVSAQGVDSAHFIFDCARPSDGNLHIEVAGVAGIDDELPGDDQAARELMLAALPPERFEDVRSRHTQAWSRLWADSPFSITNPKHALSLRLHAFHVLQTASPHSPGRNIGFPAKGWQEGYYGQVFWDEIFAFPFLVTRYPEIAAGLMRYRHRRLPAARELASDAGYSGAMFPWRSGRTGHEETPPYQYNPLSGNWMPDHTYLQRHVGSAVAYDAWLLFLATGDMALLAGEVGELILDVARFWGSCACFDESRQRYMICGVIGPDEYHNSYPDAAKPGLNNNAYTNVMGVWTLRCARKVIELLPAPQAHALRAKLAVADAELEHWDDVSRRMYLPILDDGVIEQFEGFDRLLPPDPEWLKDGRPRLDWLLESQGDNCDRYQLTKQADVLTLAYLFTTPELNELFLHMGYELDEEAARRTIDYYMSRITHESSLSEVVCAGALARFDPQASWACFEQCLNVDLQAPSDGGTREGVHLGAMAGSLDVLQRHYLGIYLYVDGIHLEPAPPAALGDVTLGFWFRGAKLVVELSGNDLRLRSDPANDLMISVRHKGEVAALAPGKVVAVHCHRG